MIVAGFGFRGATRLDSLRDALAGTGMQDRITALATAEDKVKAGVFAALAEDFDLPIRAVNEDQMRQVTTVTQSAASARHRGTGSVAEAAALAAAGAGAVLLCARVISKDRMATCAIAMAGTGTAEKGDMR